MRTSEFEGKKSEAMLSFLYIKKEDKEIKNIGHF
jgi:hypothetical protein